MSYQTGDKVKLITDYPSAPKDSIVEIVNWQYANVWLVAIGSGLSKFNFHINECDFELVKSANTPLTSGLGSHTHPNGGVAGPYSTNPGIVAIPPGYRAVFGSGLGGGGAGSGRSVPIPFASGGSIYNSPPIDFQIGEIVKFNGSDEPLLKTGMLLTIVKIRDNGDFDCTMDKYPSSDVIMVLKSEVVKRTHSVSATNSHYCTWKNYKGLSYQEEYCDGCGKSKNKRGLYE